MSEWYLEKFYKINQTKLDEKHVVCAECGDWLTTSIYLYSDGLNYCKACTYKAALGPECDIPENENITLEEILQSLELKYPCRFHIKCDFILKAADLPDHQIICAYKPIGCLLCEEKISEECNIKAHILKTHSYRGIKQNISDPVASLKLNVANLTKQYILLDLEDHSFVVFVELCKQSLLFSVGKQTLDKIPNTNLMIQYQSDKFEMKVNGTIHSIAYMIENYDTISKTELCLSSKDQERNEIDLTLYLCGFEFVEGKETDECPICFKRFTTEVYQCVNGHCLCCQCIKNVTTCAICRTDIEAGCLHYMAACDLASHAANCSYKQVKCLECDTSISKNKLYAHLDTHSDISLNLDNSYVEALLPNDAWPTYVKYKELLFCFDSISAIATESKPMSYKVRLLNCDDETKAQKYRYEVHILDEDQSSIAVHKFGNVCQSSSDTSVSSTLNGKFFKQFLRGEKNDSLNYRCCIFEV